MYRLLAKLGNIVGKGRLFKFLFNISPMYRGTGGRLMVVSPDLHYVKVKLRLNWRTRNYVGTIYGGHLYSSVDGIYMVQLINILGKAYVVWDKSASIKFKRPANQALFAEFELTKAFIEQIRNEITELGEKDYQLMIYLKDKDGNVYAEVNKVIYIAGKAFYNVKSENRKITKSLVIPGSDPGHKTEN